MKSKILTLFLTVLSVFTLFGCNKKSANVKSENKKEFSYVSEFSEVKFDKDYYPSHCAIHGGKLYIAANTVIGNKILTKAELEENPEALPCIYGYQINVYDPADDTLTKLDGYRPVGDPEKSYISALFFDENNTLTIIESADESSEESNEDVISVNHIRKLDENGEEISSESLEAKDLPGYFQTAMCDSEGNIILSSDTKICIIDNDKNVTPLQCDYYINSLFKTGDGRYCFYDYKSIYEIDVANKSLIKKEEPYAENEYIYNIASGNDKYEYFIRTVTSVYGKNIKTGNVEKLFDFLEVDINGDDILSIEQNGENFLILSGGNSENTFIDNIVLKKTSELPEVKKLTIAGYNSSGALASAAVKFNRSHDGIKIVIKDYSKYASENDQYIESAINQLKADILNSKEIDMVATGDFTSGQFDVDSVFEDLTPFFGEKIKLDDLMPAYASAMSHNGKIYEAAATMVPYTFITPSKTGITKNDFNYDTVERILNENKGKYVFGPYFENTDLLLFDYALSGDTYIDNDTGVCDFGKGTFKRAMEISKLLEKEPEEYIDEVTTIMSGEQYFSLFPIATFDNVEYYNSVMGGTIEYLGFPSDTCDIAIMSTDLIAVVKNSDNKNEAVDFVMNLLSEEYQTDYFKDNKYMGLPTNKNAYNNYINEYLTENAKFFKDGKPVKKGTLGGADYSFDYYPLTKADTDKITEMLSGEACALNINSEVMAVLNEEITPYFEGKGNIDDIIKILNSRVGIIINE